MEDQLRDQAENMEMIQYIGERLSYAEVMALCQPKIFLSPDGSDITSSTLDQVITDNKLRDLDARLETSGNNFAKIQQVNEFDSEVSYLKRELLENFAKVVTPETMLKCKELAEERFREKQEKEGRIIFTFEPKDPRTHLEPSYGNVIESLDDLKSLHNIKKSPLDNHLEAKQEYIKGMQDFILGMEPHHMSCVLENMNEKGTKSFDLKSTTPIGMMHRNYVRMELEPEMKEKMGKMSFKEISSLYSKILKSPINSAGATLPEPENQKLLRNILNIDHNTPQKTAIAEVSKTIESLASSPDFMKAVRGIIKSGLRVSKGERTQTASKTQKDKGVGKGR